ncbi:MAG: sulfite exporter TauE/SafE family protein [Burkholderiales bacterium]
MTALNDLLASMLGQPPTAWTLLAVAGAFVIGGVVKGLLGVGLPLITVPLLALVIPSPKAIALMVMPIVLSNLWQSAVGGQTRSALNRFASLLVPMVILTAITAHLTLDLPVRTLNMLVGGAVLIATAMIAWQPKLHVAPHVERRWGALVGVLTGILGGISSLMGPFLISYLVALRLPREVFVGSISLIYLAGALPLYAVMAFSGVLGWAEIAASTLALAPMSLGMFAGTRLRQHVSEALFRKLMLVFLVCVAVALFVR